MTQILRGLSGGLSNIARGVATASEDWPRASAERARLEQQKEQFDLEQARYQARLELDERKALETAKHHREAMAEGLRKDQLKILSDQMTSLGKLLPEAIGDDEAVRNIQERMEALRQEALSIAQEQEPSGVAGYPSQHGGNLGVIQDSVPAPVSRISEGIGREPIPRTEGIAGPPKQLTHEEHAKWITEAHRLKGLSTGAQAERARRAGGAGAGEFYPTFEEAKDEAARRMGIILEPYPHKPEPPRPQQMPVLTEPEEVAFEEPPPLDLSSLGKGKRAKLFNDAVDEGMQFYEDSEDIELSMRKALLQIPNASEEEIVGIRQMIEGSEPPDLLQEEINAIAKVAHDNPSSVILNNFSRSQRAAVARAMIDQGLLMTQDIPVTVIDRLADFDVALHELASLSGLVKNNPDMFGPIAGRWFKTLIWTEIREDAKSIIGRYDDVRQTVGKAKEGGVLRKEDEAKYLRIIGSIEDEPKVALFKIRHLLKSLKFQRDRYLGYVKQAGMYVDMERQAPLFPVDPKTAEIQELLFFREQWPELDKTIAERFPEEYKKYILKNEDEEEVEDKGVSISLKKVDSLSGGLPVTIKTSDLSDELVTPRGKPVRLSE